MITYLINTLKDQLVTHDSVSVSVFLWLAAGWHFKHYRLYNSPTNYSRIFSSPLPRVPAASVVPGEKGGHPSFPSTRPVMLNFGDLTRTGVSITASAAGFVSLYIEKWKRRMTFLIQ